ncbi:hypothetical protein TL16_g10541 [Triparma laevis f. inornata]|uniref:Uncharacterized protein n=1 Tax=Triparma laevis f. inornata TaxID=1714386 RepID=A0A9W7BGJ0_9STRA|nr:hypothetical protein TL16_g10541 [Triparma laevis f. inornata]
MKGQHCCSKCSEIEYCPEKHQEAHWKYHKKLCVAPQKKISAPVPSAPPVPLKGSVNEEEEYKDNCVICLVNVPDAQMCPCGHSAVCRDCTRELMTQSQLCPICRKPMVGFDVGVYSGSLGERGLWPTSARHFRELRKKKDPKKLEVLDACLALGKACGRVRDFDDARRYLKRVKEGYEEQLGRDSEKALETTSSLIIAARMSDGERIEKLRDLLKRMERALGEENVVTLHTLNEIGGELQENGEFEEAKEVWERCLAGRMKVFGEDHKDTFESLNNLGVVYDDLKNYKKALEYYKRALEGKERTLRKTHSETLMAVMNTGTTYLKLRDLGKAEELYQRALKGYEAQLGKDHVSTINCA